ncbi:MAG TPA: hypothetical protein VK168_07190 [Saprospiraceae bacterium]|nr:hypothetical protein [Saprospiraceae bacterium]
MRNIPTPSRQASVAPPWSGVQQNLVSPRRETESTRHMSCDVVFGSPSANCLGTGICRITARTGTQPVLSEQKRTCQSTVALLYPMEGGEGLTMVLTRGLLCTKLYKNHLRHGELKLDSPCPLPKALCNTLGLKIKELPVGSYKILEASGYVRIDFKIHQA